MPILTRWEPFKGRLDRWKELEDVEKITDLVKDATVTIDQAIKTASEKVSGAMVEAELEKKRARQSGKSRSSAPTGMSRKSTSTQPLAP